MEEITESPGQTQFLVAQVTAAVPAGAPLLRWGLGFRQFSFHRGEQVSRDRALDDSYPPRFASMLWSRSLSASGKLVDQSHLPGSPDCVRKTLLRLTAHPGMQIDSAVVWVLLSIESHLRSPPFEM